VNFALLIGGAAILMLAIGAFAAARRRIRSGPSNNWRNEAYLAREATGSWTENECAVGREDAAPHGILPGS
jgi:hypothetical protein